MDNSCPEDPPDFIFEDSDFCPDVADIKVQMLFKFLLLLFVCTNSDEGNICLLLKHGYKYLECPTFLLMAHMSLGKQCGPWASFICWKLIAVVVHYFLLL